MSITNSPRLRHHLRTPTELPAAAPNLAPLPCAGHPLPGGPEWTVLAAAGHTDDSLAFWHEPSHTLISGDAVLSTRRHAGSPQRLWTRPRRARPRDGCAL